MSKLLDNLEKLSRGTQAPMGFGASLSRQKAAALLVMGVLRSNDKKEVSHLVKAQCDAAVLHTDGLDWTAVEEAQTAVESVPWGVWLDCVTPEDLAKLRNGGCDFFVFQSGDVPVEALEEGEIARIMAVPVDMEDRLLRTLEDLPVDAILLRMGEMDSTLLTIRHLMQIAAVRGMTSKHLIVEGPSLPSQRELESLRDAGVDALAIETANVTVARMKELRKTLVDLPQRRSRPERASAVLPYHGVSAERAGREEEEEDELFLLDRKHEPWDASRLREGFSGDWGDRGR